MSDTDKETDNIPKYRELPLGGQLVVLLLAAGVLYCGNLGAKWFFANAKKHERKPRGERQVLVELKTLVPTTEKVTLRAVGMVIPARELALKSQVGGIVTKLHPRFEVGNSVDAGTELLELDRQDFELAVKMRQADLAKRRAEYQLELGQQEIAKSELVAAAEGGQKLTDQERSLILRKPQLAQAEAAQRSAEAAVAAAELDLKRVVVRAPFTALVRRKGADLGTQINSSTVVAELIGTDEFWVRVSVPVDELRWLTFPKSEAEKGTPVRIMPAGGLLTDASWSGNVLRLMPNLESAGRMAQVLVRVKQPLTQSPKLPLLLDSYVKVEIDGSEMKDVFAVDRSVLRAGDRIWLRDKQNRLQVRDVSIVWRGPRRVYIRDGITVGEHLVTSPIASPIPGMALRAKGDPPPPKAKGTAMKNGTNGHDGAQPASLEKKSSRGDGDHK